MRVSVVVCTWNRRALLRETLASMSRLIVPEGVEWELIVVDNGCTDDTPALLSEATNRLPLRVVREETPGLSHARNAGVGAASGAYVLWTDDDVLVPPHWLEGYTAAFRDYPEHALFGGAIRPRFLESRPVWMEEIWDRIHEVYAIRALPDEAEIRIEHPPFGANYAIRSDVQKRLPYDPDLGRKRGGLTGMEEVAVFDAALALGYLGRWVAGVEVEHMIPPERLTVSYVRRAFEGHAALEFPNLPPMGGLRVAGAPLALWKKWIQAEFAFAFARARTLDAPERWFDLLREAAARKGQLAASRSRR